jgi:hypothetical protein
MMAASIRLEGISVKIFWRACKFPKIDRDDPRLEIVVDHHTLHATIPKRATRQLESWSGAATFHGIMRLDGPPRLEGCGVQFLQPRHLQPEAMTIPSGPDAVPIRRADEVESIRTSSLPLQPTWPPQHNPTGEGGR